MKLRATSQFFGLVKGQTHICRLTRMAYTTTGYSARAQTSHYFARKLHSYYTN